MQRHIASLINNKRRTFIMIPVKSDITYTYIFYCMPTFLLSGFGSEILTRSRDKRKKNNKKKCAAKPPKDTDSLKNYLSMSSEI